jgi:anti-sigma28 factor (negative regulator of flagellin synthesis)
VEGPASKAQGISEPIGEREGENPTHFEAGARRERLAAIKAKVEAGEYSVDSQELSRKIIEDLLAKKSRV